MNFAIFMVIVLLKKIFLPVMIIVPFLKHSKQFIRCFGGLLPQRATAIANVDCDVAVIVLKIFVFKFIYFKI